MSLALSEAEAQKASEVASRLAQAYAPVAAYVVQEAAREDPPVEYSVDGVVRRQIDMLVSFFATADRLIGQEEAKLLDAFTPAGLAKLVSAVGDLQAGDAYGAVERMGGLAEESIPLTAQLLKAGIDESAAREYESAVLDLGRFVCELDGIDPSESEQLSSVKRWIDEALQAG